MSVQNDSNKLKEIKSIINEFLTSEKTDYICRMYLQEIINVVSDSNSDVTVFTLREYINEHSNGAYHHFSFSVNNANINVISVDDFLNTYNEKILDDYYVIEDKKSSSGDNCCNYECVHHLVLKRRI